MFFPLWLVFAFDSSCLVTKCLVKMTTKATVSTERAHASIPRFPALEPGGMLYLVTPFIDGGDLFDAVSREEGFSEDVAKRLFRQIVEGMLVS